MPWLAAAADLSATAKLALLQASVEAAFRDRLTIKSRDGRLLYTNRKTRTAWRWNNDRTERIKRLVVSLLPDDVEIAGLQLEGVSKGSVSVKANVLSPCGCDSSAGGLSAVTSVAHLDSEQGDSATAHADTDGPREGVLSSGTDAGPLDRVRAVELSISPVPPAPPESALSKGQEVVPAVTAEVASDPFSRQILVTHLYNVVPSMLLIARDMPQTATTAQYFHIILVNTALSAQTGFETDDLVVAPDPSLRVPVGIARLVHPDDVTLVLGFWKKFFSRTKQTREKIKEERRRQSEIEEQAAHAATIAEAAAEIAAGRGMSFDQDPDGEELVEGSPVRSLASKRSLSSEAGLIASPLAAVFAGKLRRHGAPRSDVAQIATRTLTDGPTAVDGSSNGGVKPEVWPSVEFRIMRKDGTFFWVRGQGTAITCPFDGTTKLAFTMVDVEERRSLRSQLEDERNVVSSLVDQLPTAVAIATPDGKQKWNSEYGRILGVAPGLQGTSKLSGGQSPGVVAATPPKTMHLLHGSETIFTMGGNCDLYKMPSAKMIAASSSVASPGHLSGLETTTPSIESVGTLRSGDVEAAVANNDYDALFREGLLKLYERHDYPLTRTITGGAVVEGERAVIHCRSTNCWTPITISSSPVYTTKGELVAGVATIQDISSVVREEKAKGELIVAEQAAAATRDLLSVASHESRTPLAAILAMTGFLEDGPLTVEQKECVDAIKESGRLLLTLISDLLDFNRIEAGKLELERRLFSPYELLRHVTKMMGSYGKARDIKVDLVADDKDGLFKRCMVVSDSQRLSQIIFNLASNACKFSDVGGRVVIRAGAIRCPAEQAGKAAEGDIDLVLPDGTRGEMLTLDIRVIDKGKGMPQAALNKIRMFLPFTQAESGTARKAGGFGLGLNISNKLLRLMGGQLQVDSVEGEGSTFGFTVTFPGKILPAPSPSPESRPGSVASSSSSSSGMLKIKAPKSAVPVALPLHKGPVYDFTPSIAGWAAAHEPVAIAATVNDQAVTLGGSSLSASHGAPFPARVPQGVRKDMSLLRAVVTPKGNRTIAFDSLPVGATSPSALGIGTDTLSSPVASGRNPARSPKVATGPGTESPSSGSVGSRIGTPDLAQPTGKAASELFTWQGMQPLPPVPSAPSPTSLKPSPSPADSLMTTMTSSQPVTGYRLLVAEDNKMNQKIMLRYLQKLGYSRDAVTVVEDGKEAVDELKRAFLSGTEKPYDLVLMDCLMPKYDGYYGTKAIRALPYPECSQVSVVAVTASTLQQDVDRAAESGFSGHLAKPYGAKELSAVLDRWLPSVPHTSRAESAPMGAVRQDAAAVAPSSPVATQRTPQQTNRERQPIDTSQPDTDEIPVHAAQIDDKQRDGTEPEAGSRGPSPTQPEQSSSELQPKPRSGRIRGLLQRIRQMKIPLLSKW